MSLLTICPLGAAISDLLLDSCPSDMGQIQKIIFQRLELSPGVKNQIDPVTAPLWATWLSLLAETDSTKAQISPLVAAPENDPGAALTYGGGNDTPDGIPITTGVEPSKFSCKLLRISSAVAASLKGLYGENIGVYFVNEHGRIWADSDNATTPGALYPIGIRELFVSDRKLGGFQEPDYHMLSFNLPPNWSDKIVEIIPSDFDPLTQLAN